MAAPDFADRTDFEVADGVHQVRGFGLSNTTLVEGKTGVIAIDPLISAIDPLISAGGRGAGRESGRCSACCSACWDAPDPDFALATR